MTPAPVTKVTITIASADAMERGRGARVLSFETAMTAKETHNALSVVATLLRYYTTQPAKDPQHG